MKKADLQKKLENLKLPDIELQSHKEALKNALLKQHFPETQTTHKNSWWNPVGFFKKILPTVSLSLIVVMFLFVQHQYNPSEIATAQEIVNKAIDIMQRVPNQDKETEAILAALEEAQKSQSLQYLGDETINGKKVKKLRFNDEENTLQDIIIRVDPLDTSSDAVTVSFSTDHIASQSIQFEVKDNQVLQPEVLWQNLSDSNIQKEWIKTLIRHKNLHYFEDEGLRMDESLKKTLRPFIESSEVMITSFGFSHGTDNVYYMSMQIYALGKQKEYRKQAQEYLDKAIEQLNKFSSLQAQNEIFLLERAKKSADLKYFPPEKNGSQQRYIKLSFTDSDLRSQEIIITFNLQDQSEEAIQFHAVGVDTVEIEGQFENGNIIINPESFKDKSLNKNSYKDLILQTIIQPHNEKVYKELVDSPQFSENFLQSLKPVFFSSEILIQYVSNVSKDPQGNINSFTIIVQSFDEIADGIP